MQPHDKLDDVGIADAARAVREGRQTLARAMTDPPSASRGSTPRGGDLSDLGELDEEFARLVESVTRRIQAGETVDDRRLAEDYPAWAGTLRNLLPALRGLAELGRAVEGCGTTASSDEPIGQRGRLFGDFRIVREVGRGGWASSMRPSRSRSGEGSP
jgi:hypothetical protein